MVHSDPLVGTVVDHRYVISALLGRGGMATVYLARDMRLEREVALKLMHPHLATSPNFVERFNKEARAAAKLSNPHVVAVYDQGIWETPYGSQAYLILEYVPGPDTRTELSRLGSFTIGASLHIAEQTLGALAAAHRAGLVHRDVKPENIMLTEALNPTSIFTTHPIHAKVADFGLARAISATATFSSTMGTVAYMAPEAVSQGRVEAPADIYAVGIMLYEFLTGARPFEAETPIATAYQHVNSPMPRIADEEEWFPPALDSLIGLLTAKDPRIRPADGSQALEALSAVRSTIDDDVAIRRIPVIPAPPGTHTLHNSQMSADHDVHEAREATLAEPISLRETDRAADATGAAPTAPLPLTSSFTPGSASTFTAPLTPQTDLAPTSPSTTDDKFTHTEPLTLASADLPEASVGSRARLIRDSRKRNSPKDQPARQSAQLRRRVYARKHRILPFLLLFLAFTAIATGTWYFFAGPGQRVDVPIVAGASEEQAEKTLRNHGFTVTRQEAYSDDVATGLVISSDPEGGEKIHPDTPVTITVSLGVEQVSVPNIIGQDEESARSAVQIARLGWAREEAYSETVPAGSVISQNLEAGTQVDHDSLLTATISKGREPIAVPTVTGSTKEEATAAIEKAGLGAGVSEEFSDTVAAGTVISQSPENGTLYRGDTVNIVVSKGPELVEVPSVIALSQQAATSRLEGKGFTVKVNNALPSVLGIVYSQSPKAGTMAPKGSTITITTV